MSNPSPQLSAALAACVHKGPVTLASGKVSDFYVDGRLLTLDAQGSLLVGQAVLERVKALGATAVAGPTTGACPIVSAAGVLAAQEGLPLRLVYVRSQAKGHGMEKAVEGPPLSAEDKVLFVEDVVTSGGSLARAVERLRADTPATVIGALCLLDRQAGGAAAMAEIGVELHALATRSDLDPSFQPPN